MPLLCGADGVIRGPAGDGRVAAVARDDIADVAVAVLTGEGHENQTYDLTGPEAFTLAEAAEEISRASGRLVTFENETVEAAYASRRPSGAADFEIDGWVSTYTAIAAGELETVSDCVERFLDRPPIGLADWLRANPESFRHLAHTECSPAPSAASSRTRARLRGLEQLDRVAGGVVEQDLAARPAR